MSLIEFGPRRAATNATVPSPNAPKRLRKFSQAATIPAVVRDYPPGLSGTI